jgi:hypothetical protein
MKMLPALRKPLDVYLIHHHLDPNQGMMRQRLGDQKMGPVHNVTWNYYIPRGRWEAVCEHTDVVFFAAAVPEDMEFRKGRSYDNCDGKITS